MISARLSPETLSEMKRYCAIMKMSQTDFVEAALVEYFKNHNLDTEYVLTPTQDHFILLRIEGTTPRVVEVIDRDGTPLQEVRSKMATKVNSPVRVGGEKEH